MKIVFSSRYVLNMSARWMTIGSLPCSFITFICARARSRQISIDVSTRFFAFFMRSVQVGMNNCCQLPTFSIFSIFSDLRFRNAARRDDRPAL